jgi:hypothetical protein
MTAQHAPWAAELSTFERYAKGWLVVLFGLPPAVVLAAFEGAGVHLPVWALALLALLPLVSATSGVVWGPANKTALDTSYAATLVSMPSHLTAENLPPTDDVPPSVAG